MNGLLPAPHLQNRGCRFTIIPTKGTLRPNSNSPYSGKQPQGKAWAKGGGSNYAEDDPKLQEAIAQGWNHGLVCGSGSVVVFDADEEDRLRELGVIQKLPDTVLVESRPGHRHRHYVCPELKKKFAFYDPVLTKWKLAPKPAPNKIKFTKARLHLGAAGRQHGAGVEALARLRMDDGSLVMPGQFLPWFGQAELSRLFRCGLAQAASTRGNAASTVVV